MLPLVLGSVTLAAAGYALKEYCEREGCPWDDEIPFIATRVEKDETACRNLNGTIAKNFHKNKKSHYKVGMQKYHEFLHHHNIEDKDVQTDAKLQKQKFPDNYVDDEANALLQQIVATIESLSTHIKLHADKFNTQVELTEKEKEQMKLYAQKLFALSHLQIFEWGDRLNKMEILQVLVGALDLHIQKNIKY